MAFSIWFACKIIIGKYVYNPANTLALSLSLSQNGCRENKSVKQFTLHQLLFYDQTNTIFRSIQTPCRV